MVCKMEGTVSPAERERERKGSHAPIRKKYQPLKILRTLSTSVLNSVKNCRSIVHCCADTSEQWPQLKRGLACCHHPHSVPVATRTLCCTAQAHRRIAVSLCRRVSVSSCIHLCDARERYEFQPRAMTFAKSTWSLRVGGGGGEGDAGGVRGVSVRVSVAVPRMGRRVRSGRDGRLDS